MNTRSQPFDVALAAAEFVVPFDRLTQADIEQAGGKAANLGELIGAGFPVPSGFAVTTKAYDCFVTANGLHDIIAQTLREQPGNGAAIRSAFEAAPIPPEVEQSILAAYRQLGQGPVAVRSSATAEDLPQAASAGQQDTFLNIAGAEALLNAVRLCWASLWTDRAIVYRERQGIDQTTVKLAVAVQRMVAADAAGVMFTANPVTGAREEIVINASPGLGEAVVSGLVTPDSFVLRKRRWGWRVVAQQAGRREVIIRPRPGGGTEQVEGSGAAAGPALPSRSLRQLACLGVAIQHHFGAPQDVEWAWAGGKLFILQARPMTALPDPLPKVNRLQRLQAGNFGEMMRVRPYPLDMDTWLVAAGGAIEPLVELMGFSWSLGRMFEVEDGVVVGFNLTLPRPTWRALLAPARLFSLASRYNPADWQSDPLLAEALTRTRSLEAPDPRDRSWHQLLATVRAAMEIPRLAGELRRRYFPRAAFAALRLRLLLSLLGHADQLGTLLSGAANKTAEANRVLEYLAGLVRADAELARIVAAHEPQELWAALEEQPSGRAFLDEVRAFLDEYGHRETMLSTALSPSWRDAPEVVLGIVKGFAAHPPPPRTDAPAWQTARDKVSQHPLLRIARLRSAFLATLAEARLLLQIREDTHFYATLSLPLLRRILLELGTRLAAVGIGDVAEDVFHLTLDELERVDGRLPPPANFTAALRNAIARRKAARTRLEGTPLIDPRLFPQSTPTGDELLRGMPGSPGVAEGPARIVRDGSEFSKLLPGDVLIAPYTNPSWTPLFQRAIAVVVDSGSVASHAAIVAREYGIPAVMSTVTGTHTLHDGDLVRVDGSKGVVYRVDPTPGKGDGKE